MTRRDEISRRISLWGYVISCTIEEPLDGDSRENQILPR
jgi:hypothetical protein